MTEERPREVAALGQTIERVSWADYSQRASATNPASCRIVDRGRGREADRSVRPTPLLSGSFLFQPVEDACRRIDNLLVQLAIGGDGLGQGNGDDVVAAQGGHVAE